MRLGWCRWKEGFRVKYKWLSILRIEEKFDKDFVIKNYGWWNFETLIKSEKCEIEWERFTKR